MWKPTWVGQNGVGLWQELVTADSLVAFSTPMGEKRARGTNRVKTLDLIGSDLLTKGIESSQECIAGS